MSKTISSNISNSNFLPNGTSTSSSVFSLNANDYVQINNVLPTSISRFDVIKTVKLYLPYSFSGTSVLANLLIYADSTFIGSPTIEEESGNTFLVLDITAYSFKTNNVTFKLLYNYGQTISLYTPNNSIKPKVVIEYSPFKESLEKNEQILSYEIDKDNSYSYNLFNKVLKVYKSLYPDLLKYSLSLVYSSSQKDNVFSFFPKGWRINILEYLVNQGTTIYYYDSNYHPHTMKWINLNGRYVYYDVSGTSLILEAVGSNYKLFSPYSNGYKLFDSQYRLIEINDGFGQSITISYSSTVITITDSGNNIIKFSYVTGSNINKINITLNNSNTYVLSIDTSTGLLTSIKNHYISFPSDSLTYDLNNNLNKYRTVKGDEINISYSNDDVFSINHTNSSLVFEQYSFTYRYLKTDVTNRKDITYSYTFDIDGDLLSKSELLGNKEYVHQLVLTNVYKQAFSFSDYISDYAFATNVDSTGEYQLAVSQTHSYESNKQYLIVASINKSGSIIPTDNPSYFYLAIKISYTGGQVLKYFCSYASGFEHIAFPFSLPDNVTSFSVSFLYWANNSILDDHMEISNISASIYEYEGYSENLFINGSDSSYRIQSPVNNISKDFYYADLKANQISYSLSLPFYWSNKLRELLPITSGYQYSISGSNYPLNYTFINKVRGKNDNYSLQYLTYYAGSPSYFLFNQEAHTSNNVFSSYKKLNTSFQLIEEKDEQDNVKTHSYDSSNNLISTNQSIYGLTKTISSTFTYDSGSRLSSSTSLIQTTLRSKQYTYQSNYELISSLTDENSVATNYTYQSLRHVKTISKSSSTNTLAYSTDRLASVSCGDKFTYTYNTHGQLSEIKMAPSSGSGASLLTINYSLSSTGDSLTNTYGNTYSVQSIQNVYNNLKEIKEGTSTKVKYYYYLNKPNNLLNDETQNEVTSTSKLFKIYDLYLNEKTLFDYDDYSRLSSYKKYLNNVETWSKSYTYDTSDRLIQSVFTYSSDSITTSFTYLNELSSLVIKYQNNCSIYSSVTYSLVELDAYNRLSLIRTNNSSFNLIESYVYYGTSSNYTNYISTIIHNKINYNTTYFLENEYITYDNRGFINAVRVNDGSSDTSNIEYGYDDVGRLISEIDKNNLTELAYLYDNYGNLTYIYLYWLHNDYSRGGLLTTVATYTYGGSYSNVLTSFNSKSITYDSSYNPLTYGSNISFSWTRGRLLNSYSNSSTNLSVSYEYDYQGIRTKKTLNNGDVHEFIYQNNHLLAEKVSNNQTALYTQYYLYGHKGVYGLIKNGNVYLFEKNIFNDVIAIYTSGSLVCTYSYDAFGNITSVKNPAGQTITDLTHIAHTNPFRYRSYYYDRETSLYYCLTRYYYPEWRRWLNIDDTSYLNPNSIDGINLFAYCNNNPVMLSDESGNIAITTGILIALGIVAATGFGLMVGGRASGNEALTNVGDVLLSSSEIIGGIVLIATGIGGSLGMNLLGMGAGSLINGFTNHSNGGSFHAGWAGGQVSGALTYLIQFGNLGIPLGAFAGSLLSDLIDNDYSDLSRDSVIKATWSAGLSFALSSFGNVISTHLGKNLYTPTNMFLQLLLSYQSALLGICNSIINVYWPEDDK